MSKSLRTVLAEQFNITQTATDQKIQIGGSSNYLEIADDGTIRLRGSSSVYRDMVGDLFGRRLNSTSGKVDYDWDNNAIKFQPGGSISSVSDRVQANLEIDHDRAVGSVTFSPHIHWFQEVSGGSIIAHELTLEYRVQRNGQAMTTSWTTVTLTAGATSDNWDFTGEADGFYNQISSFPDFTVTCDISDTVQFRVARTDSLTGDMLVYFMDMHGAIDSLGSEDIMSKDS